MKGKLTVKVIMSLVFSTAIIIGTSHTKCLAWDGGTHEFITQQSLSVSLKDKTLTLPEYVNQTLIKYSSEPDSSEKDSIMGIPTYEGHFYNPYTDKNYLGDYKPTAKTRANEHYNNALNYYKNKDYVNAWKELGRAFHYIEDATEPHHARNKVAFFSLHSEFENWTDNQIKKDSSDFKVYTSDQYDTVLKQSISNDVIDCAKVGYANYAEPDYTEIDRVYRSMAKTTLSYAEKNVAAVLNKFMHDTGNEPYTSWEAISDYAKLVQVGDTLYKLPHSGECVYKYDGKAYSWTKISGQARDVMELGSELYMTDYNSGNFYKYEGTPGKWEQIGGPGDQFAYANNVIYKVADKLQSIYRYDGTPNSWTKIGGQTNGLMVLGKDLYMVKNDGMFFKYTGTPNQWELFCDAPFCFYTYANNTIYRLTDNKDAIYRYDNEPNKWTKIGGAADDIITLGTDLYKVDKGTRSLEKYKGQPDQWEQFGGSGEQFVNVGNTIYEISLNQEGVYRCDGTPNKWIKIYGSANILLPRGNDLYIIENNSSKVLRYKGM